jgi:hypothetical protein
MSRSFRTKVVGVTFQNPDGTKRQDIISKCKIGEHIFLKRDYENSNDQYAIAVLRETGEQIGFLSRDVAFRHEGMNDLAPHIDQGGEVTAKIVDLIGKDITPGFWSKILGSKKTGRGCIIEIEVGSKLYQVKEAEARDLRDKAKTFEKSDPREAIRLYRQSLVKMLEVDTLIRETHFFKNQIAELGYDLGTWRRASLPIERITALLEKEKRYTECLAEIENYENVRDWKGLSKTDIQAISKRKDRIKSKITGNDKQ